MSTHEVGYSKVMRPIYSNKKIVFKIYLKGKRYISTGKVYSEFHARQVLGRGTHVFEVYQDGKPNVIFTLKLYWQPIDDALEGKIIQDLWAKAPKHGIDPDDFLVAVEDYNIMNTKIKNTNTEDKTSIFLFANDLQPQDYHWIFNPGLSDAVNINNTSQYSVGQIPGQSMGDTRVDSMVTYKLNLNPQSIRHRKHIFV